MWNGLNLGIYCLFDFLCMVGGWMRLNLDGSLVVSVGMLSHGLTFNLVSAKMCSPAKAAMHISLNQLLYVLLLNSSH